MSIPVFLPRMDFHPDRAVGCAFLAFMLESGAPQRTVMFAAEVAAVPAFVTKAVIMQIQGLVTGAIYAAYFKAQMFAKCYGEIGVSRGSWNADIRGQTITSFDPEPYNYAKPTKNEMIC